MHRWFRHYAGMTRDEKLLAAAMGSGQPLERVVWLWCAILEDAAERQEGGAFHVDLRALAWLLHCEQAELARIMEALATGGRIAGGKVIAWGVRQFESDKSTARVQVHRARRKGNGAATVQ